MATPTRPAVGPDMRSDAPGGGGKTFKRRKFHAKPGKSVDIAVLTHALEEDSGVMEELKREVESFQQSELDTSQKYLANLRKTYDRLRAAAQAKEQEHKKASEDLMRIPVPDGTTVDPMDTEAAKLEESLAALTTKLEASNMQRDVFTHMIKRLEEESIEIQRYVQYVQNELRKGKGEVPAHELAYQAAKQELKNEEDKFASLQAKVRHRRQVQETRAEGISKIIATRDLLLERAENRQRRKDDILTRSQLNLNAADESKLQKMDMVRRVYSSMLEKKIEPNEGDLEHLESTFQQIQMVTGLSDVDAVVEKFLTRDERTSQLNQVSDQLQRKVKALKEENEASATVLQKMREAAQDTSGNRKAIFEMEQANQALQELRHQCDEARKKAHRSNQAIEELTTSLTNFRSKIEGKTIAPPTTDNLPDYIRELENKLGAKMRQVHETLSHEEIDRTPAAGDGKEMVSIAKVQSEKMSRMLYNKMMDPHVIRSTNQAPRNIRVAVRAGMEDLNKRHRTSLLEGYYEDFVEADAADDGEEEDDIATAVQNGSDVTNLVVDRETFKKLATLIADKNTTKSRKKKKGVVEEE